MNKQPAAKTEKPMPQKSPATGDKSATSKQHADKPMTKPDTSKPAASAHDSKRA